ncbi:hypothetical protein ACFXPA_24600 [Amycolatopsis sp. NPDC059090]|uniref:hypothetical protein n=1 Tax=Amycolatopsis sp. NPDC059090 TaxID=3346723 RepID=UPI003672E6CF
MDEHAFAAGVAEVLVVVLLVGEDEDVVGAALEDVVGGVEVVDGAVLDARGALNACISAAAAGNCCGLTAPAVSHTGTANAPTASTPAAAGNRHDFDPSRCLPDTSHHHLLVRTRKAAPTLRIGHGNVTDK